jgi:uncharacterized protein YlxW (UPF0749 family)
MSLKRASMLVAALLVGVVVSMQWSSGIAQPGDISDQVLQTIRQLEFEQAELKRTVGLLREELDARQREMGASTELLEDLHSELIAQKVRAGLTDAEGPGVQIVLDDSHRALSPRRPLGRTWDLTGPDYVRLSEASTSDYLIHDYDLRDVVSLLWMAGAEAIAINGERIVSGSSIYCVGSTILVNDTRLSPPYQVSAIGDPRRLLDHVGNPGYLSELKLRRARAGVRLEALQAESVLAPAYRGSLPLRYAKPGS